MMLGRIIKWFLNPLWIPTLYWDAAVLERAEHRANEIDNKSFRTESEEIELEKLSDAIEEYRDIC